MNLAEGRHPKGSGGESQTPSAATSSEVEKPRDGREAVATDEHALAETPESEIERLRERVGEQEEQIRSLEEQILRLRADYENASRRHLNSMESEKFRAREGIVKGVLPLVDNLERALAALQSTGNVQALGDGIRLILRQMVDLLAREGVTEIESDGLLDPSLHEAVMREDRDDVPDQQILETLQKGYRLGQSVLRASLVKVASNPHKA